MQLSVPIGIGTMMWGTTPLDKRINGYLLPDEEVLEIVDKAVAGGVTFFDTAEGYGGGTSEVTLHRALQRSSSKSVSSTSIMGSVVAASKFLPTLWRWSEASFLRALDGSNSRMGVSSAKLYFIHSPTHPLPLETWVRAAITAFKMGKLQTLGVSNFNASQVLRAHKLCKEAGLPLVANQVMFNLLVFKSKKVQEMLQVCKELNITVIAYATVGQGLLCDGLTPEKAKKVRLSRMAGVTYDDIGGLRSVIQEIATKHNKTMSQVAINWVVCKGAVPLVGTRKVSQLEDTLGAVADGWRLSEEEVKRLDDVSLSRHLFEKPRWRRSAFVVFISGLMMAYKFSVWWANFKIW